MIPKTYTREQHSLSRKVIDPDALKVVARLNRHGYKAYIVGGGVRDLLLGKKPKDFDIVTDATPRRVRALFPYSRVIGRRFKLVHIYFFNQKVIEVATFRDASAPIDPESDEEPAIQTNDNIFGTEETDALRRDLTINGLFYDPLSGSIVDYVGGMEDLSSRVIRVIGDPDIRFREDPVRMLRVIRHAVRSGSRIDPGCYKSIQHGAHLIKTSSSVRIFEELKKDLLSGHFQAFLCILSESGLLEFLLPEIKSQMLSESAEFYGALGRADDLVRSGETLEPSDIFSIMIIFSVWEEMLEKDPKKAVEVEKDLSTLWDSEDEVIEAVRSRFEKLAVTRREREMIEGNLVLWFQLLSHASERHMNVPNQYTDRVDAILRLMKILPETSHNKAALRIVDRLERVEPERKGRERKRRRSRNSHHGHKKQGHPKKH